MLTTLYDPTLLAHVEEQKAYNESIMQATAAMSTMDPASPEGIAWTRAAMAPGGLFGMTSLDHAEVRTIDGPAGPLELRILRPPRADGVYLHLHGGAFTVGSAACMDTRNWHIATACEVATVSVEYRLAPEHPFPAGPDDCVAGARWLVEHAMDEFGTDRLLIGGESAGAYLALAVLLRLRDEDGTASRFLGADLSYGGYDLSGTPSRVQLAGKVPYAVPGNDSTRRLFVPGRTLEECRDPAVSPLWAELHELPPCLITVGTADWLLDDNLFLAARLAAAGNEVELAVYPEGNHGIESAPTEMGRIARARILDFLRSRLGSG
jgi:acetyl esterase